MADSEPTSTTFRCQCGAKLKIPTTEPGKKYSCPKCGFKFLAPAAQQAPAQSAPAPEPVDQDDPMMSDLMQLEQSAESVGQPTVAVGVTCPNCKVQMAVEATVCIACGHDVSSGKKRKAARDPGSSTAGKLAKAGGRFTLGCALSAGGALVGAATWYGIAVAAKLEIGYIAWGVGLLAGGGMLLGYGKPSIQAAFIAMVMAAGGILAAKGMIYNEFYAMLPNLGDDERRETAFWAEARCDDEYNRQGLAPWADEREDCAPDSIAVYKMSNEEAAAFRAEIEAWATTERWEDLENVRVYLTYDYAITAWWGAMGEAIDLQEGREEDEESHDDGTGDEDTSSAEWSELLQAAAARVDEVSEDSRLEEAKRINAEDMRDYHVEIKELYSSTEGSKGFWAKMFSPMDALFVLLALGTAIKVGGGQEGE